MLLTIIISFIALMGLLIIHEFGHFILAKKFGVKVEEFGVGYPPRLIGKKIGETIYSINLLPFGAFVRMPGETEKSEDPGSFSRQPVLNRILIALAVNTNKKDSPAFLDSIGNSFFHRFQYRHLCGYFR